MRALLSFLSTRWPIWASLAAISVIAGCGGGSSVLTPAGPGSKASAKPTATPSPGATASAAAALVVTHVSTAQNDVASYFATLPHSDATSDVNALLAHMQQSPLFSAADLSAGGITAMLADGTAVFVSTDHLAEAYASLQSGTAVSRSAGRVRVADSVAGPPTAAFLVNYFTADGYEFDSGRQLNFVQSFTDVGIPAVEGDTSLEDIVSLGNRTPGLDFLSIATHGGVGHYLNGKKQPAPYYLWIADDDLTVQGVETWQPDIQAGNIGYELDLYQAIQQGLTLPPDAVSAHFYFTTGFLTSHLHFNQGAIVDNQSCNGAALAETSTDVGALLARSNVGRYLGWTGTVGFTEADETDAFIVDRLTGEINPALANFVTQRSPLQRPFPLDDIDTAMASEPRSGPLGNGNEYYGTADGGLAFFDIDDFGGENVANAPIEYGLPSIERLTVVESPTGGTLTISGRFPATEGSVTITDPTAGASRDFDATSWTTSAITVSIPASGAYSKGDVQVITEAGVISNAVPLTQWHGTLTSTENETIHNVGSSPGNGTGTIVVDYTVDFRADVHPVVPAIDTTPVPQNLTFGQPEADSSAVVSQLSGTFASGDGTAMYGFSESQAPMTPAAPPPGAGTFGLAAVAGQPSSCNNALPGPQSGPTNVFCPEIGYTADAIGTCQDNDTGICTGPTWSPAGVFGSPQIASGGLLELTMDPSAYTIAVSSTEASGRDKNFEADSSSVTGNVTGTFAAPIDPPGSSEEQRSSRVRRLANRSTPLR